LQQAAYAAVKRACLAEAIALPKDAPRPFDALQPTAAYGSDHRAQEFSWQVMVMTGRALAGDAVSEAALRQILAEWAKADALMQTAPAQDSYYALKRAVLPLILGFAVIRDGWMDEAEAGFVHAWIDRLVRKMDHSFGGDVDHNNHRYLTDSVLMAWGSLNDDAALYAKGRAGYLYALEQATAEGVLPLEARRGSRAGWYLRHALASLTVMAAIAEARGDALLPHRRPWPLAKARAWPPLHGLCRMVAGTAGRELRRQADSIADGRARHAG
jgi:poly(beta-D-mannuronate) lyase